MNKGRKRQFDTFKAANEQIPPAKTYRIDEAFPDYVRMSLYCPMWSSG